MNVLLSCRYFFRCRSRYVIQSHIVRDKRDYDWKIVTVYCYLTDSIIVFPCAIIIAYIYIECANNDWLILYINIYIACVDAYIF